MLRFVRYAALLACIAGIGCDEPKPTSPPPSAPPAPPEPPKKVEEKIGWPASATIDKTARAALSPEAVTSVDRAPVPVLVVNRAPFLTASKVIAERNYYALSTQGDGVTISLSATRISYKYDGIPPQQGPERVRGIPAFVTENEAIWSATWSEYGATYAIDVECAKLPDPRCSDKKYVLELAASLAYVGGAGGAP